MRENARRSGTPRTCALCGVGVSLLCVLFEATSGWDALKGANVAPKKKPQQACEGTASRALMNATPSELSGLHQCVRPTLGPCPYTLLLRDPNLMARTAANLIGPFNSHTPGPFSSHPPWPIQLPKPPGPFTSSSSSGSFTMWKSSYRS